MTARRTTVALIGTFITVLMAATTALTTASASTLTTDVLGTPAEGTYVASAGLDADRDFTAVSGAKDTSKVLASVTSKKAYTSPTFTSTDTDCVTTLTQAGASKADITNNCTIKTQVSVTAEERPTAAETQAMNAAARTATTETTTAASTRYCKTWKQWYTTLSYHEQHIGRFCYDHVDAYVWPWGGYHYCGDNWGIGYSVDNTECYGVRVDDSSFQGGYFRQLWDWTKMTLITQGFPFSFTRKMHTNIFPSGTVVFHDN